jgi:hypothetical protein
VALGVGLVGLVTGAGLFLAGLLLLISPSREIEIPRTSESQVETARFAAIYMAEGPRHRSLNFTTIPPPDADFRPGLHMAHVRNGGDRAEPGTVRSDLQRKERSPHSCLGDSAESAHLATVPLCQDPRDALATMAAARYRGSWSRTLVIISVSRLQHAPLSVTIESE